jgi:hypothetical protein
MSFLRIIMNISHNILCILCQKQRKQITGIHFNCCVLKANLYLEKFNLFFQYYSLLPHSCLCNTLCLHLALILQLPNSLTYTTHSLSVYIYINNNDLLPFSSFSNASLFISLTQNQSRLLKSDILSK